MILTIYKYKNRPPIIAIPKCGTRFIRSSNWISLSEIDISADSYTPPTDITIDSIVTYRNPREHIISAIQTDYVWGNYYGIKQHELDKEKKWDLDVVIQNMIDDKSEHWSPNLYKNLYRIWNKFKFKMIELPKLSELFNYEIEYKSDFYDSHEMEHYISKDEILLLIPKDKLDELYTLCDKNELWLNRILNNETGLATFEELENATKQIQELIKQLETSNKENVKLKEYINVLEYYLKTLKSSTKRFL